MLKFYASNMISAQGIEVDDETNAALIARADRLRVLLEETGPQKITVPVYDVYSPEALIGHIRFTR